MLAYNWILELPNSLLWFMSVVFFALYSCGIWAGIKLLRGKKYHNEISSISHTLITGMLVPTSLTIAFIANEVWKVNEQAKATVAKEAMIANDSLRLIKQLPPTLGQPTLSSFNHYIEAVIKDEWPLMKHPKISELAEESLNLLVFDVMHLQVNVQDPFQKKLLNNLQSNLDILKVTRDERMILADYHVSSLKWFSLLVLMSICILTIFDIHYHSQRSTLKSFILVIFSFSTISFLILVHDRPLSGSTGYQPTGLKHVLKSQTNLLK